MWIRDCCANSLHLNRRRRNRQSVVDKANLMALRLTAGDTLLVNGKPMQVSQLKEETIRFVHRLGKKHLISIESDRDADYNLYFQMQNQLMEAYSQLRKRNSPEEISQGLCPLEQ